MSKPVGKAVDNPFADLEELVVPEPKPLAERLGGASASVDKLCDDSVVKALLRLPPEERAAFVRDVPEEAIQLIGYSWQDWARREQLPPPGKWGTWLILAGRGMGKMAALDTEIPTASGWKTFGTVEVGDQLWDERGQPCTVTALHPINEAPESYRATFTGGAVVDCCADHLWTTLTARDIKQLGRLGYRDAYPSDWATARYPVRDCWHNTVGHFGAEVRTTRELLATRTFMSGSRVSNNHVIPVALPVVGVPAADLPVPPWALGYWIGNGATVSGELTAGSYKGDYDDTHVRDSLLAAGFCDVVVHERRRGCTRIGSTALREALRSIGMGAPGRTKTIPDAYLLASVEQRHALLRGLMDADGYVGEGGAEFCSTLENVAESVLRLVNSLGERAQMVADRARLNGVDYGPRYRVQWRPSLFVPFSLPRKAARCPPLLRAQARKTRARAILSIEPIPPVPMRCITVDSPSGLFLITRHYIPTHNTRSGAEFIRAKVAAGAKRIALVGRTAGDVRDTMIFGESGIMAITPPAERPRYIRADRALIWPNGAQALLATAMEPDILRGPQFEVGWCLAADTMVSCFGGSKRIDAVAAGDWVLTRAGYRRVLWAGMTARSTRVTRVRLADGRWLDGTPEHKILVNGVFTPISDVRRGDIVCVEHASCSTGGSGIGTEATTTLLGRVPTRSTFTGLSGRSTTVPFRPDSTFTTSTGTGRTTGPRTSPPCPTATTPEFTWPRNLGRIERRSWQLPRQGGAVQRPFVPSFLAHASCAVRSFVPAPRIPAATAPRVVVMSSEGDRCTRSQHHAPCAARDSLRFGGATSTAHDCVGWPPSRQPKNSSPHVLLAPSAGPGSQRASVRNGSAPGDARSRTQHVRVTDVEPHYRVCDVYDLTVEGEHEFFANGVLVHNCDELASWFYPETWDNLMMCMRLGANPQVVTTTTPRPTDLIRSLVRDSTVAVTRGSTYDNAGNLPEAYITRMTEKYAGTRLGKQELYAEILDDTSGALWKMTDIPHIHQVPERLVRVITGVDPTVQAQGRGDDVGIVTVGVGESGRLYVLGDDSGQMSPSMWAEATIRAANRWGSHLIVAEGNQGGDLVRTNIIAAPLLSPDRLGIPGLKQVVIPPIDIVHARVGKVARAEPVVSLYQQRRVVHVGQHAALEDQMTTWIPDANARSPGRIDALVWAGTYVIDLVRSQAAPSRGKVMPFLVPNTPDRGAY